VTERDLPNIDRTAEALRNRRKSKEGFFMSMFQPFRGRPWLAIATGVAIVAAVLLAIPVSYDRTVGYEAVLGLSTSAVHESAVSPIAN
jgi:hypothetical protein